MPIVIKKRVNLDFIGDAYKDAYLIFGAVTVGEYDTLIPEMEKVRDDRIKATQQMLAYVKSKFISGEFPDESGKLQKVEAEDLSSLDEGTLVECFERMTGRSIDPKSVKA